jgi:hypothetical protein
MNEEKLTRRFDWVKAVLVAVTAAAVWCARLEFKSNDAKNDVDEISAKWAKDHDRLIRLEQCAEDYGWTLTNG